MIISTDTYPPVLGRMLLLSDIPFSYLYFQTLAKERKQTDFLKKVCSHRKTGMFSLVEFLHKSGITVAQQKFLPI